MLCPPLGRKNLTQRTGILLCAIMLLAAGCQQPPQVEQTAKPREPIAQRRPLVEPRPSPTAVKEARFEVGRSVEGRPIECIVLGDGAEDVLIIASIHGNEPAGTPLVHKLIDHIKKNPIIAEGRRIVIMPIANPDGYAKGLRHNVNNVDLNRNFPAENFRKTQKNGVRALSEPESRAIDKVMYEYTPKRILSLHQPINYGKACIDYDGPGSSLAACMAQHSDLTVTKLGARPGSLGSYAGETLGIPIITIELPKEATGWSADKLWARYGRMMLAAITHPNEHSVLAGMK